MKQLQRADILSTLLFTGLGIWQGQVTVFYIIYLFWFQEVIRTVIDFAYILINGNREERKTLWQAGAWGSGFILFIYFVFIVLIFGVMLNFRDVTLLGKNMQILFFRNWPFNLNILVFAIGYVFFLKTEKDMPIELKPFNHRHIILHISIIIGAFIQMAVMPRFNIENKWTSLAVIAPFLLLKLFFETRKEKLASAQP